MIDIASDTANVTAGPPAPIREQQYSGRRRPGRIENVSPELIALLRAPAPADAAGPGFDDAEPIAAARGIMMGLVLAVPLWGVIGAVAWSILS